MPWTARPTGEREGYPAGADAECEDRSCPCLFGQEGHGRIEDGGIEHARRCLVVAVGESFAEVDLGHRSTLSGRRGLRQLIFSGIDRLGRLNREGPTARPCQPPSVDLVLPRRESCDMVLSA